MWKKISLVIVLLTIWLVGCQPQVVEVEVTRTVLEVHEVEVEGDAMVVEVTRVVSEVALEDTAEEAEEASYTSLTPAPTQIAHADRSTAQQTKRLIIKEGQIELLVEEPEQIISQVNNLTAATGGFIVQQRVWDTNGYTYATIKLSVPVIEFERAMNVLREMGEVTMDAAVGQDVTDEYIDLESRLGNLRVTQERLRSFLEEASKVEDVLKINDELTKVEEELGIILGRMNYLADRAAFSNITLTINPVIPTPTTTPTSTPTPVPQWRPGETVRDAGATLQTNGQETADFLIWNLIACGPWLLLLAVLGLIAFRIWRHYWGKPTPQPIPRPTPTSTMDNEDEV